MANSYAAPNCLIDTDTTLSAFETATGHTVTTADVIFTHTGATLTVDVARSFLIAKHGETSTGDPGAGNRRGNITFNANITTTFDGNATTTNSGLKSSPGTAGAETKSNSLTILGTAAQPTVFTNAAGAYSATQRYCINWVYGIFGTMGVYSLNYPSPANAGWAFSVPISSSYTTSSAHSLGTVTMTAGNHGNTYFAVFTNAVNSARSIPITIPDITIDDSAQASAGNIVMPWYCVVAGASATDGASIDILRDKYIGPGGVTGLWQAPIKVAAGATFYGTRHGLFVTDQRATQVVPAGLTLADRGSGGELDVTWSNGGSYVAGDKLIVYNAAGDAILAVFDATVGSGSFSATNGAALTIYAKASSDNYVLSAATANVGPATPTLSEAYSPFTTLEGTRNTVVTPLSAVPSPANGGPAAWNQLGASRVGTGDAIRSIAARYAWPTPTDDAGTGKTRFPLGDTLYANGYVRVNANLEYAAVSVRYYKVGSGTVYTIMDGVHYDLIQDTLVSIQTINGGNLPSGSLAGRDVGSYILELDIAHASLPGGHIFGQSAFAIIDEPATTAVAADDTTGGVTGAIALSSILPPRGTCDKLYSAADEAARNVDPGIAQVVAPTDYKIHNVALQGTATGGGPPPTFSGITSLTDNADGTLTAGWGAATGEDEFEIHVKPTAAITAGEIAARTYLAGAADADATSQRICNTAGGAKLTAGTTYYVAVVAINDGGQDGNAVFIARAVTNPAAVTTPAPVVPGGGEALLGTGDTLVFTMPATKKGYATITVVNVDASNDRTVDLYRVRAGGSIGDGNRICAPSQNLVKNSAPLEIKVKEMQPGDMIRGLCSSANKVNVIVTTCEETIQ